MCAVALPGDSNMTPPPPEYNGYSYLFPPDPLVSLDKFICFIMLQWAIGSVDEWSKGMSGQMRPRMSPVKPHM